MTDVKDLSGAEEVFKKLELAITQGKRRNFEDILKITSNDVLKDVLSMKTDKGASLLNLAAYLEEFGMVKALIPKAPKIAFEIPDHTGNVPVSYIVAARNLEVAQILIQHTPPELLEREYNGILASKYPNMMGADKVFNHGTLLDFAISSKDPDMVKFLLPKLSDNALTMRGENGQTPLELAKINLTKLTGFSEIHDIRTIVKMIRNEIEKRFEMDKVQSTSWCCGLLHRKTEKQVEMTK